MNEIAAKLTSKDFASDQEVRWCPGCGDYSILKQVQTVLPDLGRPREEFVFISGIGCSSRFPYYMDTFGMHSIHGRATAIATGLKATRPDLSVWIITGDGDSMSIGGNHFIHLLRRNPDVNVLLFNNQIYGLTKGQYSPTSEQGKVTKSSPMGSVDYPFNPIALCLGADATFVARTMDRDPKHQQAIIKRGYDHKGTSLVEIYQNCNVFNDGAYEIYTEKSSKKEETLMMEHGKPLIFGEKNDKGIKLDGFKPVIVSLNDVSVDDLWVHDETDLVKATIISRFYDDPGKENHFPRPFGVFYVNNNKRTFDDLFNEQITEAKETKGPGELNQLLADYYTVIKNISQDIKDANKDNNSQLIEDTIRNNYVDLLMNKPAENGAPAQIGILDKIRKLRYMYNNVEYDEDTNKYHLIQKKNTIESLEAPHSDKVISYVFGVFESKTKTKKTGQKESKNKTRKLRIEEDSSIEEKTP